MKNTHKLEPLLFPYEYLNLSKEMKNVNNLPSVVIQSTYIAAFYLIMSKILSPKYLTQ